MKDKENKEDSATKAEQQADGWKAFVSPIFSEIPLTGLNLNAQPETAASGIPVQIPEEFTQALTPLFFRITAMEQRQVDGSARVEQLGMFLQEVNSSIHRDLESLRRELLGERQLLLSRHVFDAVVPVVDLLTNMCCGLDPQQDKNALTQFQAVLAALSNMMQGLGFTKFAPAKGESFDPFTMECSGHASGDAGKVVGVVSAGYRWQNVVVRAAGVVIPNPEEPQKPETEME